MIPVINRQRRVAVGAREVRRAVAAAFEREGAGEPDISVALVNDEIPCEERGEIEFKGLHYLVRIYEVVEEAGA